MNLINAINDIHNKKITVYATDVVDGVDARTLSKEEKSKYALVMGNEGQGVKREIQSL